MTLGKNRANLKLSTANAIIIASAFVWYLLAFNGLEEHASGSMALIIFGVNTGAIAVSGLLGTFIVDKFKKRRLFLYLWLVSGIALSFVPLGLNVANFTDLTIISLIFGLYFGLGMPATMGYHSSFTTVEGRGKIAGLTFLILGAGFAITGLIPIYNLFEICLILALIRVVGLAIFYFMPGKDYTKEIIRVKYTSIVANKSFILYFIPWCLFTLINFMTVPIQSQIYSPELSYTFWSSMENIVIALAALISGFVADRWGRKRLTIIGFIMLGIGYAIIGLFAENYVLLGSIIYTISDGTAWGIFYVLFLFTIWGDLAQNRNSDKFYFLGALPYLLFYSMQLIFAPILQGIGVATIFEFASIFLFLAVLPLVYAPETLPEKLMKDRDLKSYVANAKKRAQKETDKVHKKEKTLHNSPAEEKTRVYRRQKV